MEEKQVKEHDLYHSAEDVADLRQSECNPEDCFEDDTKILLVEELSSDEMDYSSEEESDVSEYEISDRIDKSYAELKSGKYEVKGFNGTLRCPFCAGKKKQDCEHKDLLQHASGVDEGSAKQKANHLALAKYLEIDLASEADQTQQEATRDRNSVAADLASKIDMTNENLDLLEYKYYEKSVSLSGTHEEKDKLHAAFVEETRKMQRLARYNVQRILSEQKILRCELENMKKFDSWNKELNKCKAVIERERQKLNEDRKQEKLSCELEKKLDSWSKELNKREAVIEHERQKLDEDRKQEKLRCELESKKKLDSWNKELKEREAVIERERLKLDEDRKQEKLSFELEKEKLGSWHKELKERGAVIERERLKRDEDWKLEKLSFELEKKKLGSWNNELKKREAVIERERQKFDEYRKQEKLRCELENKKKLSQKLPFAFQNV